MKHLQNRALASVILLTLVSASLLCGCSRFNRRYSEPCKSHAYSRTALSDFLTARFHSNSSVRLAVIPFSAPANISGLNSERPGLGLELSRKVHAQMLQTGLVPIVEVLNRQDWPGKKEEFFTGNFGAIAMAREAGYDLLLVGYVEKFKSLDRIKAYTKLIEADSGITVWYGDTEVFTNRSQLPKTDVGLWGEQRPRADLLNMPAMTESLARCIVSAVTSSGLN